jgi:hypothetical protein
VPGDSIKKTKSRMAAVTALVSSFINRVLPSGLDLHRLSPGLPGASFIATLSSVLF